MIDWLVFIVRYKLSQAVNGNNECKKMIIINSWLVVNTRQEEHGG